MKRMCQGNDGTRRKGMRESHMGRVEGERKSRKKKKQKKEKKEKDSRMEDRNEGQGKKGRKEL
jgi:hypothetical protein